MVQVHCDEGVANRIGPEPCAGNREGVGEASVGEHAGQPLSRESYSVLGADRSQGGRQHGGARHRECSSGPGVVEDPGMHGRSLRGKICCPSCGQSCRRIESGRRGAVADDARAAEVGPLRCSEEADQQTWATGAESVQRRRGAVENMVELRTDRTQGRAAVSQRLDRVRQAAGQRKKERFTALFHYVDIDLLRESFFWLQRKAAPGTRMPRCFAQQAAAGSRQVRQQIAALHTAIRSSS